MSKIEWTGKTWNPIVGCDKISAGCKNCYAIRMAYRLMHNPKMAGKYKGVAMKTVGGELNWTGKINLLSDVLYLPMTWTKPQIIFVNSMSDLFHDSIPFEFVNAVFSVMSDINIHTYQVLTKRPARMLAFFEWKKEQFGGTPWQPSDNVWLGVSVEDQKTAAERIPLLLQVPASVRFLSCEPLLEEININLFNPFYKSRSIGPTEIISKPTPNQSVLSKIDWVIAGGESGPGARPMHPDWARSLRDQCKAAGVPFFFKQWGEYLPVEEHLKDAKYTGGSGDVEYDNPTKFDKVGKKKAGRLLDGQLHDELPKLLPVIS